MRAMHELSGEELVDRSGATAQQLRRLVDLGIITPTAGPLPRSDIQRIRVVDALAEAGFAPEPLGEPNPQPRSSPIGELLDHHVGQPDAWKWSRPAR
jgi:hypothetical protein